MQISTQYSSVPAGNCVSAQTSTNQTTGPVRLAFFWLTSASGCASSCVFYYLLHRSSVTVTHGQRCGYKVLFQYNGVVLRVRMPHCQLSISNPDGRQTTNKCWARDLPSHNRVGSRIYRSRALAIARLSCPAVYWCAFLFRSLAIRS